MEIELLRYSGAKHTTMGLMFINGIFSCYTLEDEYRAQKLRGETRIPGGRYRVELRREGGMHQRYGDRFSDIHDGMLWLRDVPSFKWVYIHVGNTDDDTEGCILVADQAYSNVSDEGRIGKSTPAYRRIYSLIAKQIQGGNNVWLTAHSHQGLRF
jgi:hypothetical protein